MPRGTYLDKWTIEAILNKLMEGKSAKQISYEVKRPISTIYDLKTRHPLFGYKREEEP